MTAGITVNDFVHEPGKNDAEYIALLEEALKRQKEIVNKAIAKIKQSKPCEDCISREDALMSLTGEWKESRDELIAKYIRRIKNLPSVIPARKSGHWIDIDAWQETRSDADDVITSWVEFECECCGHQGVLRGGDYGWNYGAQISWKFCPMCGAEMEEIEDV